MDFKRQNLHKKFMSPGNIPENHRPPSLALLALAVHPDTSRDMALAWKYDCITVLSRVNIVLTSIRLLS